MPGVLGRPARGLALGALLALVLSACQVTLAVDVHVRDDGSGRVVAGVGLDDEALARVGDPATVLAADDLRAAGWEIAGPSREADGLTWLRASKGFADPDEANQVMAALSGGAGPFHDLRVTRSRSWLRTTTGFRGRVDLTTGLGGLADADLLARLGDFDPGLDIEGLRQRFGPDLAKAVKVQVSARLPGKVESNAADGKGSRATWSAELGRDTVLVADAELRRLPAAATATAGVLVVAIVSMVVVRRRRRHRAW